MEKIADKIKSFFKENKWEGIILVLILIVALGLRLYRIDEHLTFLGDEGRDVRIVRDLLKGNLVFIGPQTSIGNMYLGPLYYYMMAIPLFLSSGNPVGPAAMVAVLMTVTVFLTWLIARNWFGKSAALIAAFLFAISPVAIIYSRSSWNPNPMPFFALLAIWAIYEVWQKKRYSLISLASFGLAAGLQMHYLGLLLIPVLGLFWLLSLKEVWKSPKDKAKLVKNTLAAVVIFLVMLVPLLLFDLKHDFMNFNAFKAFFTDRQTTINLNPARSDRWDMIASQLVTDMVLGRTSIYPIVVGLILLVGFLLSLKSAKNKSGYILLAVWFFTGVLGLSVYKQHVYAHYYGFMFPAIYLFSGISLSYFISKKLPLRLAAIALLIWFVYLNLANSPVRWAPNRQMQRTEQIVDLIIKESNGEPFNFALIAKQNYDESYRYFLENKNAKMVRGETGITDQLFVVCEDGDLCQPEGNPAYQVAIFGIAKTKDTWQVDNIKIYRLTHPD